MLMKHEFQQTLKRLNLQGSNAELAEVIWRKAEQAMQGAPIQTPKLLGGNLEFQNTRQFTQAELQQLTSLLSEIYEKSTINKKYLSYRIASLWALCDKEKVETKEEFERMNSCKNEFRKEKRKIAKIENLKRKIKKQLRTKQKGKV